MVTRKPYFLYMHRLLWCGMAVPFLLISPVPACPGLGLLHPPVPRVALEPSTMLIQAHGMSKCLHDMITAGEGKRMGMRPPMADTVSQMPMNSILTGHDISHLYGQL